ncbi:MAG: glycosyltransferase [Bacteroidales bacterium]|nr:glycosyltransferase [Bacteroidales bacterium]
MKSESKPRMHVLYLPRWYPHRYDPMMGLFIERHGLAVSKHVDVSVLYVHADDKLKDRVYDVVRSNDGLFTIRIYFKKSTIRPAFLANLVNLFRFLICHFHGFRMIRKEKRSADLVHVHVLTRLGLIALINKIFNKTPYTITEHWTRYLPNTDTYHGTLRKWFTQIVVKNAAAVLPVTANLRDAMIENKLINDNYVVIPNVVNIEMFSPKTNKAVHKKKRLVHLSCFTDKQKNISGILRVMKRLSDKRDDFELTLIGDGEDFAEMKALSNKLGLTDKAVKFAGLKENKALVELLSDADLMIMFSYFENLPVVILESYACGVPVVSTRVGGIHEHLNDDLGKLTKPGDEDEFFETLNDVLDKLDDYDSKKIRKYAEDHFSNEVIGNSLFNVYREVTSS